MHDRRARRFYARASPYNIWDLNDESLKRFVIRTKSGGLTGNLYTILCFRNQAMASFRESSTGRNSIPSSFLALVLSK